jgi:hypothetical protein
VWNREKQPDRPALDPGMKDLFGGPWDEGFQVRISTERTGGVRLSRVEGPALVLGEQPSW